MERKESGQGERDGETLGGGRNEGNRDRRRGSGGQSGAEVG